MLSCDWLESPNGPINGLMDGWMMDGWMDGWINIKYQIIVCMEGGGDMLTKQIQKYFKCFKHDKKYVIFKEFGDVLQHTARS